MDGNKNSALGWSLASGAVTLFLIVGVQTRALSGNSHGENQEEKVLAGMALFLAIGGVGAGIDAMVRTGSNPDRRAERNRAIAGLSLSVLLMGLLSFVIFESQKANANRQRGGRAIGAIKTLGTIHSLQAEFKERFGRFATLSDLAERKLLEKTYAEGSPVAGYRYTLSEATAESYCLHAVRANASIGSRDFTITESGEIRFRESQTPAPLARDEGEALLRN